MSEDMAVYGGGKYCGNCGMRVDGECTLVDTKELQACLCSSDRPHWRKRIEPVINPATLHARTCRCDACMEYWSRQQVEPDRIPKAPCDLCEHDKNQDIGPCVKCDAGNDQFTPIHDPDAPMVGMEEYLEQKQEPGKKFDSGKPRYDLLPGDVLEEITIIFTQGAEKYGDRNWEKGMSWGRVFGAAMRHMWAFWTGKTTDDESGRPHLAHAIVNLMFLLAYYIRGVGTDDRKV